ncbi:TonB-dependent receptor domain-containing protein [Paucibacter sp. XJ19-41]|uniref:TonB-dependent receptor domain-containing protein n=1 Tax=Paucibacter sp. XJ19-41 TaxID=2927824 RepID=UPI00234AAB36|nr:TonB-dependent receptor [Paucibacter sp. XJ19-41]
MSRSTQRRAQWALTGVAMASALACFNIHAAEPTALERVEVTGSRIKRVDAEGAAPVQVLRREEIKASGAATVQELIRQLAASTTSLSDLSGSNSFAGGASSASLRNLGKQSTLTLLNFRRVAPYPLADYNQTFTNIDSLPLEAVERIEILKTGGAAIYGSDAVAGVINIVTRSDYEGLIAKVTGQSSLKNSQFNDRSATITGGFGSLNKDRFNVLANLDVYTRNGVMWNEVLDDVNPAYRTYSSGFGTPSSYSWPGNFRRRGADGKIALVPATNCPPAQIVSGLCQYDRYERFEATPASDRVTALVSGRLLISDTLEGFSELLFSRTKTSYQSAYDAYGDGIAPTVWGDPQTNGLKSFTPRGLPAGHPLNNTGAEAAFRYRFNDAGSSKVATTDQYRALAGLKGTFAGYDWETAVGVMGGKTTSDQRGSFSVDGFKEVIGDYTKPVLDADFFNKPNGYKLGQANSADVLNKLFPVFGYSATTKQYFLDGKLSGELGQWTGGAIGFASGFELRREEVDIGPRGGLERGDIVGYGSVRADASRNYGAVFGEVSLPLSKQLEMQAAARIDKFPGFSAHVSPKLSLRFQPNKEVLLRGTLETGFRAPNLTENAPSTKFAFNNNINDPKRCAQATAYSRDLKAQAAALPAGDSNKQLLTAQADSVTGECRVGVASIVAHNPKLKPETSKSLTFGAAFSPARDVALTADYWIIERKSEIGRKSTNDLLSIEDTLAPGVVNRLPLENDAYFDAAARAKYGVTAGRLASVVAQFENLFSTKTSGVDVSFKTQGNTPIGKLGLDAEATYVISYRAWVASRKGYGDNLAGRYDYPRWKSKMAVSHNLGKFSQVLSLHFTSSRLLNDDFNAPAWTVEDCAKTKGLTEAQCIVAPESRLDYNVSYDVTKALKLSANVRNLLDERPSTNYRAFGVGGIIPQDREDVQGRMLRLTAEYTFW